MSLGNIQTEIVKFVNEALLENYSASALETAINMTLRGLSKHNILKTSTTDDITAGDQSFDQPTDFKDLVTLYMNDGTVDMAPLRAFSGGQFDYRAVVKWRDSSDVGTPAWYANFEDLFYFHPAANQNLTAHIEFYRYHPADDGKNILFGEEAKDAIFAGVTYHKALLVKKTEYIGIWVSVWLEQKELVRLLNPPQPAVTK